VVRKLTYEELKKVIENIELNFILRGVKDKSIYKDWRTNVIFKNYAAAYSQLGSFCGNAKMYDKAEVYFQKAIELSPDTADHYLGLGMVMEHTGRIDKAKELYHKAIKLNPDDTRIQTRLNKIEKNTS
jgi:tetratricopeptide (TPR) repeat protein